MLFLLSLTSALAAPPLPRQVCGFDDSLVGPTLLLRLPGTERTFALASGYGGAPTLKGILGIAETGKPALRATIAGGGLSVAADVGGAPLELVRVVSTRSALLLEGGVMHVDGFRGATVLAHPASGDIDPVKPLVVTLNCSDLRVRGYLSATPSWQARAALEVPEVVWAEHVKLRDAPGGRVVARAAEGATLEVGVLERKGAWARVAAPDGDVVWLGWMPTKDLDVRVVGGRVGGSGGLGASRSVVSVACSEALPLSFRGEGGVAVVGEVAPGTAFTVVSIEGEHAVVGFHRRWLEASGGVFVLPAAAAQCPTVEGPR